MFNYYHVTVGNENQSHILSYKLKTHRPAQIWAKLMSENNITQLREGHEILYGVPLDPIPYINELLALIDVLNQWMPEKITHVWDYNDLQGSANLFHTHFPEHKTDTDPVHRKQLERYNDLIHYIENINRSNYYPYPQLHLLVATDVIELEYSDYQYFTLQTQFGDLHLGYPHIGRHPSEIMWAMDLDVPTDQILPQHRLNGFHWCKFYDSLSYDRCMEQFKNFYIESKIKWPYALDDPRLAVGNLHIGNLELVDEKKLSNEEITNIVISCDRVLGWTIN